MHRYLLAAAMTAALTGCVATGPAPQPGHDATQSGLVLPVPDNYCELSADHPQDRQMLDLTAELNMNHNRVLSFFADCEQLAAWRSEGYDFEQYGMYLSPLSSDGQRYQMTRQDFVDVMVDELGQFDSMDAIKEEMEQRIEEADISFNLHDMVHLGLLHTDDSGAYTGVLQRVSDDSGYEADVVVVTGLTLLQGQVVTMNLSAPYQGQESIQLLLVQQRRNLRQLVEANRG